jgi:hypothetical protein
MMVAFTPCSDQLSLSSRSSHGAVCLSMCVCVERKTTCDHQLGCQGAFSAQLNRVVKGDVHSNECPVGRDDGRGQKCLEAETLSQGGPEGWPAITKSPKCPNEHARVPALAPPITSEFAKKALGYSIGTEAYSCASAKRGWPKETHAVRTRWGMRKWPTSAVSKIAHRA